MSTPTQKWSLPSIKPTPKHIIDMIANGQAFYREPKPYKVCWLVPGVQQ